MRGYYLLPLLFLLLIAPASGYYFVNDTDTKTSTFDYTPGSQMYITQIDVSDLDTPSNTTIILTVPGGTAAYTIFYNTTSSLGLIRAQGSITEPNGNVTVFDKTSLSFSIFDLPKSSIVVQYYFYDEGVTRVGLIFNVYPGVPFAEWRWFSNTAMGDFWSYREDLVIFGKAQVDSTDTFNSFAVYMTPDEIEALGSGSTAGIWWETGGQEAISSLWDRLLDIISWIPVVGPPMAIFIDELFWLINFAFIENWLGTIVLIEFLAISEGLIYAKKRGNIALMKRVASNHIALFGMIVTVMMFLYERIIIRAIEVIADLIPG